MHPRLEKRRRGPLNTHERIALCDIARDRRPTPWVLALERRGMVREVATSVVVEPSRAWVRATYELTSRGERVLEQLVARLPQLADRPTLPRWARHLSCSCGIRHDFARL